MTLDDFTGIYDLYQSAIFRYCFWKCRDRDAGLDLTQETFLRAWDFIAKGGDVRHMRGFLYKIANNLIINNAKKKKTVSLDQLLENGFEPAIDPWHHTHVRLDSERPLQKLSTMRTPYRQVLHQRFILGLAPVEIATITGETANTVSVRIFRGLEHLRSLIEDVPASSLTLS